MCAALKYEVKTSCSQCMLEMSSVSCNAGSQTLAPFHDYTGNHSLIKTVPLLLDPLVQLLHILDLAPVNEVPQNPHTA